ncbi:MAG: hypothetical protein K6G81_09080 [Lachnospiraceae bacterium]|nr:hypothetical protein [Lachnospiraceae bacterium]
MTDKQREWAMTRDKLAEAVEQLGFPRKLGEEIAVQLGGIKAMERMLAYLQYVKPDSAELIVDEMLAIKSDIDRWRDKKASEEANARYTEYLENRRKR